MSGPAGSRPVGYLEAAWSWHQHLRTAGSTPWTEWTARSAGSVPPEQPVPAGWTVPGAAQLELVRRLAERSVLEETSFARLADLVLSRSGPGRGLAQQPLAWPGAAGCFGPPPVDPGEVPLEELLRVGVGALTELLLAGPQPAVKRASVRRRLLSGTPAFELAGTPVTTSAVRRALALAGHVEGGRDPRVVVVVEPLDQALFQTWSARAQAGSTVRWRGFVRRWVGRRELPASADPLGLARHWSARVGADHVHLVVAPTPLDAAEKVGVVLGVGLASSRRPRLPGDPPVLALPPAAVEVMRRVNAVLNVRVHEPRRAAVRRTLGATLVEASRDAGGATLTVPLPLQDWVRERAERAVEELTSAGYPVHGRLVDAVPGFRGTATHPRRADALDLVVDACLDRARLDRPSTEGGAP